MIDDILRKKNAHVDKIIADFQKEFKALSGDVQTEVLKLFRQGRFDRAGFVAAFDGYEQLADDFLARNAELIKYTKEIATELGVKFALTEEGLKAYDLLQDIIFDRLKNLNAQYIDDMRLFGLRSQLEGASRQKMMGGLQEMFDSMGRNLNAEINTATGYMDSVVKKDFYEQAGIEKYKYFGPLDAKTRDECRDTLSDPRQQTGWTMAEIESSATPFIERGGWNCRHEWIAFVGDE